ncbi:sporulation protein YabP [Halothermothrix orenii]|uniref:YabP family protein n=1 Tax=Halothermothrix orenii (strain H 168 / OCM 544 / DSM 9562) TaxID=373903 RepID=B8D053_HALOH|nr:sporulation protein YabP [Halothermothrix orenii]ACL68807.1 YabP family protein [Halothermothrix orenii H 168]
MDKKKNNSGQKTTPARHTLSLNNRKELELDGVREVISYNEDKIIMQTSMGVLEIKGKELNIQKLNLDEGTVKIKGHFSSLDYSDREPGKNFMNRLFR